jgi:hypothetical protein
MGFALFAAVISTLHLAGPVAADGGDYLVIDFEVPAGTVEFQIAHSDESTSDVLDWGVWSPEGFRGWGGGLTDPAIIGVDQSSRSYLPGPITPGTWQLVIGKATLTSSAGQYVVDLEFRDAATLTPVARADFDPVVVERGARWYAGDLHVHSEQSGDAAATLGEITDLARSVGLDFVVITDHNTIAHHALLAAVQPTLTDLLLVRGIEVTTYAGHGNAIGVSAYVDHRVGLDGVSARTIIDDVAAQGGVFTVNHPELDLGDACIGCAWRHDDTPWDEVSAMELITGPYAVTGTLFTPQVIERWDALLDQGLHIGAVGGSDDHTAGMGTSTTQSPIGSPTTMVYADELSEAAVREAIRAGHTVVKLRGNDDPMVDLTAATADGGVARVGDTVTGVGRARLSAHVTGGAGSFLELWRDGVKLETVPVGGDDATLDFDYPVTGAPERYRVEIIAGAGRATVTSHLWIDGDPALDDGGGCGCRASAPSSVAPIALAILVLASSRWPRRRRRR